MFNKITKKDKNARKNIFELALEKLKANIRLRPLHNLLTTTSTDTLATTPTAAVQSMAMDVPLENLSKKEEKRSKKEEEETENLEEPEEHAEEHEALLQKLAVQARVKM